MEQPSHDLRFHKLNFWQFQVNQRHGSHFVWHNLPMVLYGQYFQDPKFAFEQNLCFWFLSWDDRKVIWGHVEGMKIWLFSFQKNHARHLKVIMKPSNSWVKRNASQKDIKLPSWLTRFADWLRVDPSHFIFEINVGKSRIRHIMTLYLILQSILIRSWNSSVNFRVVVRRIRLFPTLIAKIKWVWTTLKSRAVLICFWDAFNFISGHT